jgi:hypothetical protein
MEGLPGYRTIGAPVNSAADSPDEEHRRWLQQHNGAVAFGGALRFFPMTSAEGLRDIASWNERELWAAWYGPLAPGRLWIFAEDAFGVQFGFLTGGELARFWNETGEVEALDVDVVEFVRLIAGDPDGTLSYRLFLDTQRALGPLGLSEHWAFRVETALGGDLAIDNLQRMDAVAHMQACGKIAQQISSLEIGTGIDEVEPE